MEWNIIQDTIQGDKCILILGPEVFTKPPDEGSPGKMLFQQLTDYLSKAETQVADKIYPSDELFLFKKPGAKTMAYYQIKAFYRQEFEHAKPVLEKIARIPFNVIINLTPDKQLANVFKNLQLPYRFDFYFKNRPPAANMATPTKELPLIYNLFGSIDEQESLVLTHDDLFSYFHSIFGTGSMHQELKYLIKRADNFLFLGVQFDKWYMQLLLRLLYYLRTEKEDWMQQEDFMRFATSQTMTDEIKTMCMEQFRINFINTNIPEFVDKLYKSCDEESMLRKPKEAERPITDDLFKLIAMDEIKNALQAFEKYLKKIGDVAQDVLYELMLLMGRYEYLQSERTAGTMDTEKATVEANRIRKSLIGLIKKAEELV